MTLLGIDVGTTHCKAALFDDTGEVIRAASCLTPTERAGEGEATHDPQKLWDAIVSIVRTVTLGERPVAVGVASMAEAGLLIDRRTGEPRTPILAWFDTRSTQQSEELAAREDPLDQFRRSGLHPSFKYGLSKILWLRRQDPEVTVGACWLSVADYVVFRLTGEFATDPTLAARTYAYRITDETWDEAWIEDLGLDPSNFPRVLPSGVPAGKVNREGAHSGLSQGVPVAVAGHDHVCSMLAAGVVEPGPVLDSVGTAESIMAVTSQVELGAEELVNGLALVPHVLPGKYCWLGGLSAAGGSIEWLRAQLGAQTISYAEIEAEVAGTLPGPTRVLFFPYLLGSGAPLPDRRVRAAFIGLRMENGRGDLFKAVLEGTAYEAESIRRTVVKASGCPAGEVIAVGGGARNGRWLQIKADVSGCVHRVPALPEAAALGAAIASGLGTGALAGISEATNIAGRYRTAGLTVEPEQNRSSAYRALYECSYLPMQDPLRRLAASLDERRAGASGPQRDLEAGT